jgi:RNA polymerase sigma-70 factor (ECF subfamily)
MGAGAAPRRGSTAIRRPAFSAPSCAHICVDELSADQRAVITLRDLVGMPADEVCELLELSDGNQRVLLHRARARVRAALSPLVEVVG